MADEDEAHGDAVGDTHQVHDTIHPMDLPTDHPARPEAERKFGEAREKETEEYDEERGIPE